jgi:carboxymethylenebutenolidase
MPIETVQIKRGGSKTSLDAYMFMPEGEGSSPGVVVIHEIFGMNDNIRNIAARFAEEGYAAIAVDLFSTGRNAICMMRLMYGMLVRPLKNGVVGDLGTAIEYFKTLPQVDADRIGVVGFCMGGSYALQLACTGHGMKAASVFYGTNPRPLSAIADACPVVGSYPVGDVTANSGRRLLRALEKHNIPHDMKTYENAAHSFCNDELEAFNPDVCKDAWQRMVAFFGEHIKAGDVG